jgi:ribonuclease Z
VEFKVTILGVGAAVPTLQHHPSSQMVTIRNHSFLVDCGEGTQMQLLKYAFLKPSRIRAIFISHLHGDHVFGLIGMLHSFALQGRQDRIDIYGPSGLQQLIDVQMKVTGAQLPFPCVIHQIDCQTFQCIYEDSKVAVWSIPLRHRIETSGYLFREKQVARNIIPETIDQYQMAYQTIRAVKAGEDLVLPDKSVIPNKDLTTDPPAPRSFAYCSDTRYTETILPYIKEVDLLYHETTFCEDNQAKAEKTMHTTAKEAAILARKAEVGYLITGHYSSRYPKTEVFLKEALEEFDRVSLGEEGYTYSLEWKGKRVVKKVGPLEH